MKLTNNTAVSMSREFGCFMAVLALLLLSGAAFAADNTLLAFNRPAKQDIKIISSELKAASTAQMNNDPISSTDFDAFSAVNDPLYREGSRELLQQAAKEEPSSGKKISKGFRDAPVSRISGPAKVSPAVKKARAGKVIHADPVKSKNSL